MKELDFLRKLKSVAFATIEDGLPSVRIADVMLIEDEKIYFLTDRGKSFYRQLIENKNVALVGMDENYVSIRISGKAIQADCTYVDRIFEENPSLGDIYAPNTRDILEAFCICEGIGEIFDLSDKQPKRTRFAFGGAEPVASGYSIKKDACIKCRVCVVSCPVGAISEKDEALVIDNTSCLECGRCFEFCPVEAIEQPSKFLMEES
jgi:uncharacterized pyridoxamine 5'-phosphate oxidase family protein